MVKLREINDGSLVFEEGWRDFVLNHSISVGEVVVFEHISIALFTVQIYGTSGCERVEFQGKENSNNLKRKRTKNEITPDILCPSKAQKSYKTSEGKYNASVKESSMKDRVEKTFPIRLAGNETAAGKSITRSAREHTYSLKESPPRDDGHRKLRNSSMMNHSEAPNKIINQGKKIEESGRNSPIVLSDDDEETDEVIMIKDYSYVDKSNGGTKSSANEHVENRKGNLVVDKRSANRCFLTTERKSSVERKEVIEMTPNASMHPGTSQSKHNSRGINISAANEGKMSVREKAVAVEHNKDRKEGVAACNKSKTRCLLALDNKSSVIDKISVSKQEVIKVTPITSAHPQILETRSSSQDANRSEINEENTSHTCNSPKRPKTVSADECTKLETRIKIEDNCEIVAPPLADERLPMVGCLQGQYIAAEGQMTNDKIIRNIGSEPEVFRNKLDDEEFAGNSYGRPEDLTPEFVEDEEGNLVPKEFSCKSLVMKEGMCYNPVQDSKPKLGANVDVSIGLHAEDDGKNLILAEEFARNCLVKGEGACYPVVEDSKDKLEERIDSYIDLGAEYEGGNLIVPNEVVSKSLVRGDDACYIANEDSMDELEVRNGTSVSFSAAKEDCNVLDADIGIINKYAFLHENVPEAPSNALLLNCNVDDQGSLPPPCKGIINCGQSEEKLDPSQATAVKSSPLVMADVFESPIGPTTMEGDPLPSGIIPGELPEMDAEKVDPCSKGEVLTVVKTEIMDSTDSLSLRNVKFSTTASLISQSWLLLPEKLPARPLKNRCLRKVVLLQDPSMNLWPVLYHEGFSFIGFVGGWEDFIIANNLQQGDTCQIESVSASEPTFKVQFSHVQKPA